MGMVVSMARSEPPRPKCFESDDAWRAWRRRAGPGVNYCADCTQEFKARMMRHGRCQWPAVRFVRGKDGETIGKRFASG